MRYVDDPTWMSLTDAAEALGVSAKTVRRMVDLHQAGARGRGTLKGERISSAEGSHRRVDRADVEREKVDRARPDTAGTRDHVP